MARSVHTEVVHDDRRAVHAAQATLSRATLNLIHSVCPLRPDNPKQANLRHQALVSGHIIFNIAWMKPGSMLAAAFW